MEVPRPRIVFLSLISFVYIFATRSEINSKQASTHLPSSWRFFTQPYVSPCSPSSSFSRAVIFVVSYPSCVTGNSRIRQGMYLQVLGWLCAQFAPTICLRQPASSFNTRRSFRRKRGTGGGVGHDVPVFQWCFSGGRDVRGRYSNPLAPKGSAVQDHLCGRRL